MRGFIDIVENASNISEVKYWVDAGGILIRVDNHDIDAEDRGYGCGEHDICDADDDDALGARDDAMRNGEVRLNISRTRDYAGELGVEFDPEHVSKHALTKVIEIIRSEPEIGFYFINDQMFERKRDAMSALRRGKIVESTYEQLSAEERELIDRYSYGDCDILALVLHDRTGWPLEASVNRGGYAHVWVVHPSGQALDICGLQDRETVYQNWATLGSERKIVSREWLLDNMPEHQKDPFWIKKAEEAVDGYLLPSLSAAPSIVESADAQSELARITQDAANLGVTLVVGEFEGLIDLSAIQRKDGAEKGAGATVMQMLCGYADRSGQPISLYASGFQPKLEAFYNRFGFVTDDSMDDEAYMIRQPRRSR